MFNETNDKLTINEAKAKTLGLSEKITNSRTLYDLRMAMPFRIKPLKPGSNGVIPKEVEEMTKELRVWLEEIRKKILGPFKKDFSSFLMTDINIIQTFERRFEELTERETPKPEPPPKPPFEWNRRPPHPFLPEEF